jgi:hypothetical protein
LLGICRIDYNKIGGTKFDQILLCEVCPTKRAEEFDMKLASVGFVLTMTICLPLLSENAFAEPELYTVKQAAPSAGSSIRRPIVVAGTTPLDKRYADLTTEQKNGLKSVYEKMGDNDEPPFPASGLMPLYRKLAEVHEKLDLLYKGPVTMYVQVDSQGNPGALYVVESPDQQISQAVANMLAVQKFKPALCNGTPCSQRYVFHAELVGPDWQNNGATAISYKIRDM